jgi:telomerase Cajal body protein 1
MKGIISALSLSDQTGNGILAAGTFTRMIGLYDSEGSGDCIAVFSIARTTSEESTSGSGAGITSLEWSPCGRYLYVAERKSAEILVYDIRVTGRKVGSLMGRTAASNQRLGIHVVPANRGHEVWAGCDDGVVRVWRLTGEDLEASGQLGPNWAWKAHDGTSLEQDSQHGSFFDIRCHPGPISATIVHPSGTVVGTCSGQRYISLENDRESEKPDGGIETLSSSLPLHCTEKPFDNTLKIWKI